MNCQQNIYHEERKRYHYYGDKRDVTLLVNLDDAIHSIFKPKSHVTYTNLQETIFMSPNLNG